MILYNSSPEQIIGCMIYGEVSEWLKELVLKTSDPARDRGFESHPLCQFFHLWRSTQVGEEAPLLRV